MSMIWPEVSRASKFLMSRFSFLRESTEKAIAMEMTRGIPSGMQTIRRAMAVEARSMARLMD
jgi:phospholipase C